MLRLFSNEGTERDPITCHFNYKVTEEINTATTIEFSVDTNESVVKYIETEGYIENEDNRFVIKEKKFSGDNLNIFGIADTEELRGTKVYKFQITDSRVDEAFKLALSYIADTTWTVVNKSTITRKRSTRLSRKTVWEIIQELVTLYYIEVKYDTKNKKIYIYDNKGMGSDNGAQFRDDVNLEDLEINEDTLDFCTVLYCYGKDNMTFSSVNDGKMYVTNYTWSKKKIRQYWIDERYTNKESFLDAAKLKIDELGTPKISYTAKIIDLRKLIVNGAKIFGFSLGDTISIISRNRNTTIKQRVVRYERYPDEPERNTITLSTRKRTLEDKEAKIRKWVENAEPSVSSDGSVNNVDENSIGSTQLKEASVKSMHIADAQIQSAHIAEAAIAEAHIGEAVIKEAHIRDAQITGAKIKEGSIGTAHIGLGVITTALIEKAFVDRVIAVEAEINRLDAKYLKVDEAALKYATIENLNADIAKINESKIGIADVETLLSEKAYLTKVEAEELYAGSADFNELKANAITTTTLDSKVSDLGYAKVDIVEAANARIDDLYAEHTYLKEATAEKITAIEADLNHITSNYLEVDIAEARYVTTEYLESNYLKATTIASTYVTTDNLYADFMTAERINATFATLDGLNSEVGRIDKLFSDYATIEMINTDYLTADQIRSDYAKIEQVNAEIAKIDNLFADYVKITDLEAEYIKAAAIEAKYATIANLNAANANITSLQSTVADIEKAYMDEAEVETLIASKGYLTEAQVNTLIVDKGYFTEAQVETLVAGKGYITTTETETLLADYATVTQLDTSNANISALQTKVAEIDKAYMTEAEVDTLVVSKGYLTEAQVNTLVVNKGYLTEAQVNTLIVSKGYLVEAEVETLITKKGYFTEAQVENLVVGKGYITTTETETLLADYATVNSLKAVDAKFGTLSTTYATVDLANVEDGSITTAMIGTGVVGTAQIADGSVTNAKIVELTANKITAGTLSVERLEIRGSNASLVYALNNITGALQSQNVNTLNGEILTERTITADKIVANAITANEIASKTITANQIAAGTITATEIKSSAITADKLSVSTLSAITANLGTVTAGILMSTNYKESDYSVDSSGNVTGSVLSGLKIDLDNMAYYTPQVTIKDNFVLVNGFVTIGTRNKSYDAGAYSLSVGANNIAAPYTATIGYQNEASQPFSFAQGIQAVASGLYSLAHGFCAVASGSTTYSGGAFTKATAYTAHAEGWYSEAKADYTHAEGKYTIASSEAQHVQGKYNIADSSGTYAHIVGNGSSSARSNAHTLDWDGNAWYAGNVYVGSKNEKLAIGGRGIFYIEGTGSTAGTWLGSCDEITSYYDGLTIAYKVGIAGVSGGTTLNINSLGAIDVMRNASSAVTTHYGVGSVVILTYTTDEGTGYWKIADYDANTNTQIRVYRQTSSYNGDYPLLVSRTKAASLATVGSNGSYEAVYGVMWDDEDLVPTLNPSTGLIKAAGITITKNELTFDTGTTQSATKGIKWTAINSKTPYIGYATDQSDGTFVVCSLLGTAYSTGLAIGGGSGNLLYKANAVLHAGNYTSYCAKASHSHSNYVDLTSAQTISGAKTFSGNNSFTGKNIFTASNTYNTVDSCKFVVGNDNSAFVFGGDGLQCYAGTNSTTGKIFYVNYYGGDVSIGKSGGAQAITVNGQTTMNAGSGDTTLQLNSKSAGSYIGFGGTSTTRMGFLGFSATNNPVFYHTTDGAKTLLHAGNYSSYALPLSGGTLTGDLTVGSASLGTNGYVTGTWLKTTANIALSSAATTFAVLSGGWIYSRTAAQVLSDIGAAAVVLNGSNKAGTTASFYAPVAAGSSGAVLVSNGSGAPSWNATTGHSGTRTGVIKIGKFVIEFGSVSVTSGTSAWGDGYAAYADVTFENTFTQNPAVIVSWAGRYSGMLDCGSSGVTTTGASVWGKISTASKAYTLQWIAIGCIA